MRIPLKKTLLISSLILIVCLLVACGNDVESGTSNSNAQNNSNSDAKVTDSNKMIFDFIIRQYMADRDAAVFQRHFLLDVSWEELNFKAASVFTREVQHHTGRYDVQEDVSISGRVSADEKSIETLVFKNERTGVIYEMLEFEFANIPYNDDDPSDSDYEFYVREGVDSLNEYIKVWNEQTVRDGDIRDITEKFEGMAKYDQEAEIKIFFLLN